MRHLFISLLDYSLLDYFFLAMVFLPLLERAEQRRFVLQLLRNFGMGKKVMEESVILETGKINQDIENKLQSTKSSVFHITAFFRLARQCCFFDACWKNFCISRRSEVSTIRKCK